MKMKGIGADSQLGSEHTQAHTLAQTSRCDVKNYLRDERHPSHHLLSLLLTSPFPSSSTSIPPPLFSPPHALLRSDESRPAAINSGSVGEMTAS